jgi:sorting nexin-29
LKIATWNVLSLYRAGTLRILLDELAKYKTDIAAIQEVRWLGKGTIEKSNCTVFYSCHEREHAFGTGFIVSKRVKHLVIGFTAVDHRISCIRITGKFFNYSIINAHAPTEEKSDIEKEAFYVKLSKTYQDCPNHDIKIVVGDFNAKIGRESFYTSVVGKHSLHADTSDNGTRLIDFAVSHNMIVGSTYLPRKDIHKGTWKAPGNRNVNQIDHLLIDARHKSDLMDVRTYRGANIDSDHYLVLSRIRSRISNAKKHRGSRSRKINTEPLKSPETAEQFESAMNQKLEDIDEELEERDVNGYWESIKSVINSTAEEVLGNKQPEPRNIWFDDECQQATNEKNAAYLKMQQRHHTRQAVHEYRELRKKEKKLHRKKKRVYLENQIKEAELLNSQNESRVFYRKINGQRKEYKPRITMCHDKEGNILNDKQQILKRWVEHFDTLLNDVDNGNPLVAASTSNSNNSLDDTEPPPTLAEVSSAIKTLHNNKSPGTDNLPAELFKCGGERLHSHLHKIIATIWQSEILPEEWNCGIICPLHKKGDPMNCANYRGITLLNIAYKILSNILCNRLKKYAEELIGNYQTGFRSGKSTTDQIFCLRQILEKTNEFNTDTYHLFIDFRAAYDTVNRAKLYRAMEEFNIPIKLINLVKLTMSNVECRVRIQEDLSEPLKTLNGLRQGDALACMLFNMALEKAIRDAGVQTTGHIFNKSVQLLAYADDIDIIARSLSDLKTAFRALASSAKNMGLEVNGAKTKYMPINGRQNPPSLLIDGYCFETVSEFIYLGTMVTGNNDVAAEIKRRIVTANRSYFGLQRQMKSRHLSRKTKLLLYKTLVRPVLTYGSECWTISKSDEGALERFERKVLRRIFGPICDNGEWRIRRNDELYSLYKDATITTEIRIGRLRWAGHIQRMADEDMPKKILNGMPGGRRRPRRPKLRWLDGVVRDARQIGISNWRSAALDRQSWRQALEEAKTRPGL